MWRYHSKCDIRQLQDSFLPALLDNDWLLKDAMNLCPQDSEVKEAERQYYPILVAPRTLVIVVYHQILLLHNLDISYQYHRAADLLDRI